MTDPKADQTHSFNANIPQAVRAVVDRLQTSGFKAVLVGGCVRDLVMGVPPKDYDIATSATPPEVQRLFERVIPTGIQHGTVTVLLDGMSMEVTTFRAEGPYLDGRRPSTVTFGTDLVEDLARRDFTINAMALDPLTQLISDPFGGQADLSRRCVRCVGEPEERFSEDGLRSLRAVRFATSLGFELEPRTALAIPKRLASFRKVSVERIREEFCKILLSDRAPSGIELLRTTGLLESFLPEVLEGAGQMQDARYGNDVYGHTLATLAASPTDLPLRLACLLHDVAKRRTAAPRPDGGGFDFPEHEVMGASMAEQAMERLKFPRSTIDEVATLVRHHRLDWLGNWSDARIRHVLARQGERGVQRQLAFAQFNFRGRSVPAEREVAQLKALENQIQAVLAERPPLRIADLALDGHALMRLLNVGPSPIIGQVTHFLMARVLENPSLNAVPTLTELVKEWQRSNGR